MKAAPRIVLGEEEKETLERWRRSQRAERRLVERAAIILLSGEGFESKEIAQRLGTREATVSKWRNRFYRDRLSGLKDAPRAGAPCKYDEQTERRILEALDQDPPPGHGVWDGVLLSEHFGDVDKQHIWKVLRKHGIHLKRRHSWCISTDPEFAVKAADIVGLYLNPPENAMVICVDEKPAIQALERAKGWLRLPNGKALTGYNHEYKRHGTTTLFGALEVATGLVKTGHFNRRRRREFLSFMNEVIANHRDKEIHVILDNLKTHKPKRDMWLARHRNVHFHYTPTHASWLNQIEVWFSILTRKAIVNSSFTSINQVRERIDLFAKAYNATAAPFEWKKKIVHQGKLKDKFANLQN